MRRRNERKSEAENGAKPGLEAIVLEFVGAQKSFSRAKMERLRVGRQPEIAAKTAETQPQTLKNKSRRYASADASCRTESRGGNVRAGWQIRQKRIRARQD